MLPQKPSLLSTDVHFNTTLNRFRQQLDLLRASQPKQLLPSKAQRVQRRLVRSTEPQQSPNFASLLGSGNTARRLVAEGLTWEWDTMTRHFL